jgi:nucleoside-diphosphate-sugar epimerase
METWAKRHLQGIAMKKTALIVGVSGIVGRNLADLLVAEREWTVYGMARRPGQRSGIVPVAVDCWTQPPLRPRWRT